MIYAFLADPLYSTIHELMVSIFEHLSKQKIPSFDDLLDGQIIVGLIRQWDGGKAVPIPNYDINSFDPPLPSMSERKFGNWLEIADFTNSRWISLNNSISLDISFNRIKAMEINADFAIFLMTNLLFIIYLGSVPEADFEVIRVIAAQQSSKSADQNSELTSQELVSCVSNSLFLAADSKPRNILDCLIRDVTRHVMFDYDGLFVHTVTNLQDIIHKGKAEKKKLQSELNQALNSVDQKDDMKMVMEMELNEARNQLQKHSEEKQTLMRKLDDLKEEVTDLKSSFDQSQKCINDLEEITKQLQDQILAKSNAMTDLKNQIRNFEALNYELQMNTENLRRQIQQLEDEKFEIDDAKSGLVDELEKLKNEKASIEGFLAYSQSEIKKYVNFKEKFLETEKQLTFYVKLKDDLLQKQNATDGKIMELIEENKALKNNSLILQTQVNVLRTEVLKKDNEIIFLTSSIDNLSNVFASGKNNKRITTANGQRFISEILGSTKDQRPKSPNCRNDPWAIEQSKVERNLCVTLCEEIESMLKAMYDATVYADVIEESELSAQQNNESNLTSKQLAA